MKEPVVSWWGKVVFIFACTSVALIGIGRLEISFLHFSAWSVSRTAFFFWVFWRVVGWSGAKANPWQWHPRSLSIPLFFFVGWVTLSLFPRFHDLGDYRYLMFGVGHYLMLLDLFAGTRRRALLYYLLGIVPGFLLLRGIAADPSILNFSLASRFAYPLDHPNIAGHLFSMTIPLCLSVIFHNGRALRSFGILSLLCQFGGLILTFSRNAWIACSASLLSLCLREKRFWSFLLGLATISVIVLALSSELRDRLWSLPDALNDPHVVWRTNAMKAAVAAGLNRPLFGNGYGRRHLRAALHESDPEFAREFVPHSHSLYTELVSAVGVVGLGIFLWLLASACLRLVQDIVKQGDGATSNRFISLGLFGSLIAFIVGGVADVPLYHHETRIFFFTLLALIQLQFQENRGRQTVMSET